MFLVVLGPVQHLAGTRKLLLRLAGPLGLELHPLRLLGDPDGRELVQLALLVPVLALGLLQR